MRKPQRKLENEYYLLIFFFSLRLISVPNVIAFVVILFVMVLSFGVALALAFAMCNNNDWSCTRCILNKSNGKYAHVKSLRVRQFSL